MSQSPGRPTTPNTRPALPLPTDTDHDPITPHRDTPAAPLAVQPSPSTPSRPGPDYLPTAPTGDGLTHDFGLIPKEPTEVDSLAGSMARLTTSFSSYRSEIRESVQLIARRSVFAFLFGLVTGADAALPRTAFELMSVIPDMARAAFSGVGHVCTIVYVSSSGSLMRTSWPVLAVCGAAMDKNIVSCAVGNLAGAQDLLAEWLGITLWESVGAFRMGKPRATVGLGAASEWKLAPLLDPEQCGGDADESGLIAAGFGVKWCIHTSVMGQPVYGSNIMTRLSADGRPVVIGVRTDEALAAIQGTDSSALETPIPSHDALAADCTSYPDDLRELCFDLWSRQVVGMAGVKGGVVLRFDAIHHRVFASDARALGHHAVDVVLDPTSRCPFVVRGKDEDDFCIGDVALESATRALHGVSGGQLTSDHISTLVTDSIGSRQDMERTCLAVVVDGLGTFPAVLRQRNPTATIGSSPSRPSAKSSSPGPRASEYEVILPGGLIEQVDSPPEPSSEQTGPTSVQLPSAAPEREKRTRDDSAEAPGASGSRPEKRARK